MNTNRLSDKVAIVTGASKGIGAGIATALAAAGARVAVNYSSDKQGAERVAEAITCSTLSVTTAGTVTMIRGAGRFASAAIGAVQNHLSVMR